MYVCSISISLKYLSIFLLFFFGHMAQANFDFVLNSQINMLLLSDPKQGKCLAIATRARFFMKIVLKTAIIGQANAKITELTSVRWGMILWLNEIHSEFFHKFTPKQQWSDKNEDLILAQLIREWSLQKYVHSWSDALLLHFKHSREKKR